MPTAQIFYRYLFAVLWFGWALYWWALARSSKRSVRSEPRGSRLLHVVPLIIAAMLLGAPRLGIPALHGRFLPWMPMFFWAGAAITVAGLLFSVWARRHIGTNWSGIVTIKEGHELITSGPYAIVRHPIYTGLLLGFAGSALAVGEWRGVLAFVIVFWALWRKARYEERWMHEQFGDAYTEYSKHVAALIPGIL